MPYLRINGVIVDYSGNTAKAFSKSMLRYIDMICPRGFAPSWHSKNHPDCKEYTDAFLLYGPQGKIIYQLPGRIIEWHRLPIDVYVFNPSIELRQHKHGRCLQLLKPESLWFKLHWEKPAKYFDEARAYVEQLLAEAFF